MKKQEAINVPSEGLIMDLNPLSMPNNALTNCLNGTLLTYNGNEYMLQNDMGNARVETAMLPTGYIPLGSTSFGGIIYIVSYNPIEKKYQIGSFPSPERNLTKDELGNADRTTIDLDKFCDENGWTNGEGFGSTSNIITNYYQKVNLLKNLIYPGDKYKVFFKDWDSGYKAFLSAYGDPDQKPNNLPRYLKFDIVSTLDTGKTITLTDDSVWTVQEGGPFYLYLTPITGATNNETISLDEYRGLVGSNYDTYVSKLSGQLGIVARLEVPTSFSVGYDIVFDQSFEENGTILKQSYQFYFYLNWTNDNVGKHKNRINPQAIIYKTRNTDEDYQSNLIPIELQTSSEENPDEVDYYTTIAPQNFYQDNFPLKEFLQGELDIPLNTFNTSKFRQNDGSDFQYIVKGPLITKQITTIGQAASIEYFINEKKLFRSDALKITVTPVMPFGQLQFLQKEILLNLTKVNSGEINLFNYQYYVSNGRVNIDYNLEAYPVFGERITGGLINFYYLADNLNDCWKQQSTYDSQLGQRQTSLLKADFHIPLQEPYNGLGYVQFDSSKLKENGIYIAEFVINYTEGNRYFYRLFFNSGIFNNAYGSGEDFKDLNLYEEGQKYGLSPTLKCKQGIKTNEADPSLLTVWETYYDQEQSVEKEEEYRVTHEIESEVSIETGLGDELTINPNGLTMSDEIKVSKKETDDNLYILREGLKDTSDSFSYKDGVLKLLNIFSVKIPYKIEYSDIQSLDCYSLIPLIDGAAGHKVTLQHVSRAEEKGKFQLFVNSSNRINDEDDIQKEYEVTDDTNDVHFTMSAIESVLNKIIVENEYDYLTVVFGIAKMWDNDCGYGFEEYDQRGEEQFYKCSPAPSDYFSKITCIRKNGYAALVHGTGLQLIKIDANIHKQDNKDCYAYRNFEQLVRNLDKKDHQGGTIVPTEVIPKSGIDTVNKTCTNDYRSEYSKYKKTGTTKTVYYIDGSKLDYAQDPTVSLIYTISLNLPQTPTINIGNKPISIGTLENGFAHNLYINLKQFDIEIPISTRIRNTSWVNSHLLLDNSICWDSDNNVPIPYDKTQNVFTSDGSSVVPYLVLNDNGLVELSTDFSSKCAMTEWYFGWEHTDGTKGKPISKSYLKNSKQWYSIGYTYASPDIKVTEVINPISLYYKMSYSETELVKGNTIQIHIERTSAPEDFNGGTINIKYEGRIAEEEGADGPLEFVDTFSNSNYTIDVRLIDNVCTISLWYEGREVGTLTLPDIKDPEPETT